MKWHRLPADEFRKKHRQDADATRLIPEIFEVRGYAEITAAYKGDDGLQIIALLSGHTNLALLKLALDFEILAFDRVDNFLCLVAFESLLNLQFLPRVSQWRNRGLNLLDVPQIDSALAELADDNLAQPTEPRRVFGRERDLFFLGHDFRDAPLEIEARCQFLARLVQGIINFLRVHF